MMKVAATVNDPSLTASGISGTGATLTVGGHVGAWSYQGISGTEASSTCADVSAGTTTATLNLTADKLYGYTAYSGAGCTGTEIDTEYFSTNDFDVGNLGEGASGSHCKAGYESVTLKCAVAFTTGSRSGGYTLKSVTGSFNDDFGTTNPFVIKIHAADTNDSSNPGAEVVTLSGNDPKTAGLYTYTCPSGDTGCELAANTTYFVVMSATTVLQTRYYQLKLTASDAESSHPSGNGWSIANTGRAQSGNAWSAMSSGNTPLLHIAVNNPVARVSATNVSSGGATLSISNHSGAWYYKQVHPTTGSCVTVSSGATATPSSLTADTLYGFTAYTGTNCTTATNTVYFSVTNYGVGNLTEANADPNCLAGHQGGGKQQCAMAFTTGIRTGGYTLQNVTARFVRKGRYARQHRRESPR